MSEIFIDARKPNGRGCVGVSVYVDNVTIGPFNPDNTPPVLTLPDDQTEEATGPDGAVVTYPEPTAEDETDGPITPVCSHSSGDTFPLGETTVSCTATDAAGNSTDGSFTVTVEDTTPPTLEVTLSTEVLWPANHKMRHIDVEIVALDLVTASPIVVLDSVVSSEPDDAPGGGDGNTTGDIQGALFGDPDFDFSLRAERQGGGDGRVYTVTYTATDEAGNSTAESATVTVPHDRRRR